MKFNRTHIFILILVLLLLASSGCGAGQFLGPSPTPPATSTPTNTPAPTLTPTPTLPPTLTPTPTAVPAMRTPISSGKWQVTVISALSRERLIYGYFGWKPKPGYIFIDVGIRITNLKPEAGDLIAIEDLKVIDANGQNWDVLDYGSAIAGKKDINTQSIGINKCGNDVCKESDVLMRVIYAGSSDVVASPFILHFKDVPLIQFSVEGKAG